MNCNPMRRAGGAPPRSGFAAALAAAALVFVAAASAGAQTPAAGARTPAGAGPSASAGFANPLIPGIASEPSVTPRGQD